MSSHWQTLNWSIGSKILLKILQFYKKCLYYKLFYRHMVWEYMEGYLKFIDVVGTNIWNVLIDCFGFSPYRHVNRWPRKGKQDHTSETREKVGKNNWDCGWNEQKCYQMTEIKQYKRNATNTELKFRSS